MVEGANGDSGWHGWRQSLSEASVPALHAHQGRTRIARVNDGVHSAESNSVHPPQISLIGKYRVPDSFLFLKMIDQDFIFNIINHSNYRLYHQFSHPRSGSMEHLLVENYDNCCDCDRPGLRVGNAPRRETNPFAKGICIPNSIQIPSISILAGAIGSAFGCYLDSALSQAGSFLSIPEG
jgi:hypothetical protein